MNGQTERRKYARIKTHIPVRYRKLQGGTGVADESSITKNLSLGGIRFRVAEFISMACRLMLEMDLPMGTKPVKAISKVAWIKKTASGNDFEVGNQFLEMSKEDKELVSKYVNSLKMYNEPGSEATDGSDEIKAAKDTPQDAPAI